MCAAVQDVRLDARQRLSHSIFEACGGYIAAGQKSTILRLLYRYRASGRRVNFGIYFTVTVVDNDAPLNRPLRASRCSKRFILSPVRMAVIAECQCSNVRWFPWRVSDP